MALIFINSLLIFSIALDNCQKATDHYHFLKNTIDSLKQMLPYNINKRFKLIKIIW
jgi:hypothetical protein